MKKILFALLVTTAFFSCESEDHDVDNNNFKGSEVAYFTDGVSSSYFVTPTADVTRIQVGSTSTSPSARNYTVEVDPASTAIAGVDYTLPSTTVTIPANEYFGYVEVQGIFAGTTPEGSNLILNLKGNGNFANASYDLGIFQQCVSDLGGMYSVTTSYGFHDFLPNFSTNTQDVEIIALGDGLYEIGDFSGGLYDGGPYTAAYGTGPTSFTVQFSENCGIISWAGQSDPWGACIPLDGGVNAVSFADGVITMSWFCEGYGENGVSIYTPL